MWFYLILINKAIKIKIKQSVKLANQIICNSLINLSKRYGITAMISMKNLKYLPIFF